MEFEDILPYENLNRLNRELKHALIRGYDSITNEQRLWRCVLIELCVDAIDFVEGKRMTPSATTDDLHDAFAAVYESTEDFELLCNLSAVNHKRLRLYIMHFVKSMNNFSSVLDRFTNDVPVFNGDNMPFKEFEQVSIFGEEE